jgi:energy-coupling factor transporter transmembrane protein EcfT
MALEPNSTSALPSSDWRFSLRQLFVWMAVIALGCVALRNASGAWVAAMLGLAQLALATAILLVIFRRGAERAYWIGFATFGWLYLLLVLVNWSFASNTNSASLFGPHHLATTRLSDACYHCLFDEAFERYFAKFPLPSSGDPAAPRMATSAIPPPVAFNPALGSMGQRPPYPGPDEGSFANVAHALWTILLAAIGGCLARWLYTTNQERRPADGPAASAS